MNLTITILTISLFSPSIVNTKISWLAPAFGIDKLWLEIQDSNRFANILKVGEMGGNSQETKEQDTAADKLAKVRCIINLEAESAYN